MYQFLTKRPRCLSRIVSSMQRRKKNKPGVNTSLPSHGRIEIDSHADTVVLGSNCVVLHHMGKVCEVPPYTDEYDAITDVPVVRGATLWMDQHTNEEYILIFNEALWMGDTLAHSLINPNQLRAFGTLVQDNPYHTDPLGIKPPPYDLEIPLRTAGTIIYADTRAPTRNELATRPIIALTSSSDWDPHHVRFPSHNVEEARRATINAIQSRQQRDVHQYGCYNIEPGLQGTVDDPATFSIRLISAVQIHDPLQLKEDVPSSKTFHTSERKSTVSASDLSERWFIGLKQATQTIKSTSQRLLRSAILPLAQRYHADRMYDRPRFRGVIYTDTMHGHFKSLDGNKYAQIFATEDYFAAAYPMESKLLAGDALKEFITDYGVPDKIIMDGAGEQTGKRSTFMEQVRKHHVDYHVTEPERYNQPRVERVIWEI